MELKKLQKLIEAINAYYAFVLLLYAAALYIARHSQLFFWVLIATTPLLAGWTGYLLKSFLERRNYRQGFRVLSDVMSYEIANKHASTLRYSTTLKAGTDHLMVVPIEYQWTGSGKEAVPQVIGKGQQLLAPVQQHSSKDNTAKIAPYKLTGSTEGDWHAWFVALNPPVHKGDIVEIKYSQEFHDKSSTAKPILYYFVRVPMERLELNVKFPKNALPRTVIGSYIKTSSPRRPHMREDVIYDPDKQWATWIIERPKKGYCYRIQWQ